MITAASSASAQPTAQTTADARAKLGETVDNFLLLLTEQLKNQDPLSPMDNAEFTNQLVGFSTVEQLITQNEKLDGLLGAANGSALQGYVDYIGMRVETPGNTFNHDGTPARLAYAVGEGTTSTNLVIYDAAGRRVWTGAGETGTGKHWLSWDGLDADGQTLPPGVYQISVEAQSADGTAVATATHVTGTVTGVETSDGQPVLKMGDIEIDPNDVLSIHQPEIEFSRRAVRTKSKETLRG